MTDKFKIVGIIKKPDLLHNKKLKKKIPYVSLGLFAVILFLCMFCGLFVKNDPTYMDLYNAEVKPCKEFLFGTDTLGRDIFSMVWYGGRISLVIGFLSALISTFIGIIIGTISAFSPKWIDLVIMRFTDIFLSIPSLLLVVLIQAIFGEANILSIAILTGITGWTSISKVVRSEVLVLKHSEYVIAAKCMGAGFFRILFKHLIPNFISSIMFIAVMNVRNAIVFESTLSFMGLGLPLETISLGSMLSLSEKSLISGSWWIILVPGLLLTLTLVLITNIGNYLRQGGTLKHSNL